MNAKKFFRDNIQRIAHPEADPLGWNLNQGLLALAEQIEQLQLQLQRQENEIRALKADVRRTQPR